MFDKFSLMSYYYKSWRRSWLNPTANVWGLAASLLWKKEINVSIESWIVYKVFKSIYAKNFVVTLFQIDRTRYVTDQLEITIFTGSSTGINFGWGWGTDMLMEFDYIQNGK